MRDARNMTNEELAWQLRYFFNHPPDEGLSFVKAFIGKVRRGFPITEKMRWKAVAMVNESYAGNEPLVEDDNG